MRITDMDPCMNINNRSKVVRDKKKNEFPWWISSSGISLPVILMDLRWIKSPKIDPVTVVG